MGMSSMTEDARAKALEAANRWFETPEAEELLAKMDAFEEMADHWYSECQPAAKGFSEAARYAESDLEDLRSKAVDDAADTYSSERSDDEWIDAWSAADEDAPRVEQIVAQARRNHAGADYLRRMGS